MNIGPRGGYVGPAQGLGSSIDAEDEDAARQLLADASTILQNRVANVPPDFVIQVFAGAVPEDLVRYQATEIAEIAAGTWRFLGTRPQVPKIQVGTAQPTSGQRLKDVSIVEILNDDMPFLVNSVMAELAEQGLEPHLVLHPRFVVERDMTGTLIALSAPSTRGANPRRESLIQVHVDRIDDEDVRSALVIALDNVLTDVRRVVEDWRAMLERVSTLITGLTNGQPPSRVDDLDESLAFLKWLMDDNFTFLGVRDYLYNEEGNAPAVIFASALGILRGREGDVFAADGGRPALAPRALEALREPKTLIITKTNSRSRVHRRTSMDHIVVKRYDRDGKLTGGIQIVGLFTSTAYVRSTRSIPHLRRKVANVVARIGFDVMSHSGKALLNLLETYPRDEIFQIDERNGQDQSQPADEGYFGDAIEASHQDPAAADGPDDRRAHSAHAKLRERLEKGGPLPDYFKNHPIYYAGPAKTPEGYASGAFGPTTAGRMDSFVDDFQAAGGPMVMLAKGNRAPAVREACKNPAASISARSAALPPTSPSTASRRSRSWNIPSSAWKRSGASRSSTSPPSSSSTTRATTSSRSSISGDVAIQSQLVFSCQHYLGEIAVLMI